MSSASTETRTDAALLRAHAAGDRHAFEELFRRHRPRLYRVARRRTLSAEDADDAVQEAMLSAHRGAGSFRYDASVGSWLHRIVVNACQDRLRRNAVRPTTAITDDDCVPVADRTAALETARAISDCDASVSTSQGHFLAANSRGFRGGYPYSRHSLGVAPIAKRGRSMQRDGWYTSERDALLLKEPERVGRYAAERSLSRLGSRKLSTRRVPILFEAPLASGLVQGAWALTASTSPSTVCTQPHRLVGLLLLPHVWTTL